jgi:hypothetical protein
MAVFTAAPTEAIVIAYVGDQLASVESYGRVRTPRPGTPLSGGAEIVERGHRSTGGVEGHRQPYHLIGLVWGGAPARANRGEPMLESGQRRCGSAKR